ncbi:MAG: DUF1844 domain-containing protein [Planctomycetota bacterium]
MTETPPAAMPAPDFLKYLQGFATQVLIHLGEIDNPLEGKRTVNLELAKYAIDLLALIGTKTRGNLTPEESKFITGALYDLRMKFVARSARR